MRHAVAAALEEAAKDKEAALAAAAKDKEAALAAAAKIYEAALRAAVEDTAKNNKDAAAAAAAAATRPRPRDEPSTAAVGSRLVGLEQLVASCVRQLSIPLECCLSRRKGRERAPTDDDRAAAAEAPLRRRRSMQLKV